MEPRKCFENTLSFIEENPGCSMLVGYALMNGTWIYHGWIMGSDGGLIETTFPREAYFGMVLTPYEVEMTRKEVN
jgi:hypothetical protein